MTEPRQAESSSIIETHTSPSKNGGNERKPANSDATRHEADLVAHQMWELERNSLELKKALIAEKATVEALTNEKDAWKAAMETKMEELHEMFKEQAEAIVNQSALVERQEETISRQENLMEQQADILESQAEIIKALEEERDALVDERDKLRQELMTVSPNGQPKVSDNPFSFNVNFD